MWIPCPQVQHAYEYSRNSGSIQNVPRESLAYVGTITEHVAGSSARYVAPARRILRPHIYKLAITRHKRTKKRLLEPKMKEIMHRAIKNQQVAAFSLHTWYNTR